MSTDEQNNEAEQQQKRQRGRPRKWPKERRIPPIREGRMSFKPGDAHPMDAQLDQASELREAIKEEIAELQEILRSLEELSDPTEVISREEEEVKKLLWDVYK